MNYNMQGMDMIMKLFAVLKETKVEIKKEHQVFMVNKTTGFKKGKGKKGKFMNGKPVAALVKKPKVEPKPETSASIVRGTTTGSRTAPNTW